MSTAAVSAPAADYRIGPRDALSSTVVDFPELGGKFRATDTGYLQFPSLPAPIKAEGRAGVELSKAIAKALKSAELLQEPIVSVSMKDYHSRTIVALGAVQKASVYPQGIQV
jgi:protein involved in polysaccharide export with SLBB domain